MAAGITASKRSPLRTHRDSSGLVEPEGVLHSLIVMRGNLVDQEKRGQAGQWTREPFLTFVPLLLSRAGHALASKNLHRSGEQFRPPSLCSPPGLSAIPFVLAQPASL